MFWLVMLLISGTPENLRASLVFMVCAFLSILVHEMGHGLASRLVGGEPLEIVLYWFGGYCVTPQDRRSPWRRLFVLACGPGAGFVLFGVVLGAVAYWGYPESPALRSGVYDLLFINLAWGVLNLFPIYPLDGGQMVGVALGMVHARHGVRWSHVVSLLTAGGLAVWRASQDDFMMALWFGYFAFINYQILQSLHASARFGDNPEW
jgi:membrane-associated protease RseP (regulator of RpoE activity)